MRAVALAAGLFVTAGADAFAANTNIKAEVTGQSSTGGVSPTTAGNTWFYDYSIPVGAAVNDTISVSVCETVTSPGDGAGFPNSVAVDAPTAGLPGVTNSVTELSYNAPGCQQFTITVATGAMNTAGTFASNIHLRKGDEPDSRTKVNVDGGHIQVRVTVVEATDPTSCFFTDSSFNFLQDCAGNDIRSGDAGWFAIVANKKNVAVSTNPGQFYYNVLWTNTTGVEQTVSVNFTRTNVSPKGAQAIHAKAFPSFPVLDPADFDAVNDGIPGGSDDNISGVTVKPGWTLWVTYHVEWTGVGAPILTPPSVCGAAPAGTFFVSAVVTDQAGVTLGGPCSAGASGFRK